MDKALELLPQKARDIALELKENLKRLYDGQILRIVVFGSYATGEQTGESDLDILVVTTDKRLEGSVDDIVYDIMWKVDFKPFISVYVVDQQHFDLIKNIGTGFYENIEKEAIEV